MRKILFFVFSILILVSGKVFAMPVSCDYTYTGSTGNYLLNFTFVNNIPNTYNQHIGEVAIDLPYDGLAGEPMTKFWVQAPSGNILNNFAQGGSNIDYQNVWVGAWKYNLSTDMRTPVNDIQSGESLSGFTVHADKIPDVIHFTALANDTLYIQNGQDHLGGPGYYLDDAFLKGHTIGFEGIVRGPEPVVPEPTSMFLLGSGLVGMFFRRKFSNHSLPLRHIRDVLA